MKRMPIPLFSFSRHRVALAVTVALGALAPLSTTSAKTYSPVSSVLYYEIGGAELVNPSVTTISLAAGLNLSQDLRLPTVCEIWEKKLWANPKHVADMVENYVVGQIRNIGPYIISYLATSAQTLAVAALQRALPGMYDYSQNLFAQLQVDVDLAKKSCQQAVDDMDAGLNPFKGWMDVSYSYNWQNTLSDTYTTRTNPIEAKEDIDAAPTEQDVPWFGTTKKGGASTLPIMLVKDVTSAGYAAMVGGTYDGTNPVTAANTHSEEVVGGTAAANEADRMQTVFPTSTDMVTFANQLVGEQEISYCALCASGKVTPGVGLRPTYLEERNELIKEWNALITKYPNMTTFPTIAEFDAVSSSRVRITRPLYESLLSLPTVQDRNVFIYRLATDAAVDRTVEKAMVLRQALKAGHGTPQVQGIDPAREDIETYIDQVKTEIDDFLWEIQTQDEMISKTAKNLIQYDMANRNRRSSTPYGFPVVRPRDDAPLREGDYTTD